MNQAPNQNPNPHVPPRRWDKPTQYQTGWVEFYKLKFKVTPDVLIPRPESELLVDEVLSSLPTFPPTLTILDIGTGSGCLAISIIKHLPTWNVGTQIIATDISEKALQIAKQNARLHGVEDKIAFIQSDLLKNSLILNTNPYALITVTNLPYIPSARIPYLDESVKNYEPIIALDGGTDGFELYRKLFQQIRTYNPGLNLNLQSGIGRLKLIICEIDYTHGEIAYDEAKKYFPKAEVEVKKDLAKKQRILLIKL